MAELIKHHFKKYFYLFLAVLGILCCAKTFSSCIEQRLLSSFCAQAFHGGSFSCCRAWALGYMGFSSPVVYRIFLDQGWNPCSLHWQVDSLLPDHQSSSKCIVS